MVLRRKTELRLITPAAQLDILLLATTVPGSSGASKSNPTPDLSDLISGLEAGVLVPVIGHEFPLADAAKAHDQVMRPGAYGKIVLIP